MDEMYTGYLKMGSGTQQQNSNFTGFLQTQKLRQYQHEGSGQSDQFKQSNFKIRRKHNDPSSSQSTYSSLEQEQKIRLNRKMAHSLTKSQVQPLAKSRASADPTKQGSMQQSTTQMPSNTLLNKTLVALLKQGGSSNLASATEQSNKTSQAAGMAAALIGRSSTAQKNGGQVRKSKAEVFNATAPVRFSISKQAEDDSNALFRLNDPNSLQTATQQESELDPLTGEPRTQSSVTGLAGGRLWEAASGLSHHNNTRQTNSKVAVNLNQTVAIGSSNQKDQSQRQCAGAKSLGPAGAMPKVEGKAPKAAGVSGTRNSANKFGVSQKTIRISATTAAPPINKTDSNLGLSSQNLTHDYQSHDKQAQLAPKTGMMAVGMGRYQAPVHPKMSDKKKSSQQNQSCQKLASKTEQSQLQQPVALQAQSLSSSKVNLRLVNQKNRSAQSLSQERKMIAPAQIKFKQVTQQQAKVPLIEDKNHNAMRIKLQTKTSSQSVAGGGTSGTNLKKKQTMRGLVEAQKAIKGHVTLQKPQQHAPTMVAVTSTNNHNDQRRGSASSITVSAKEPGKEVHVFAKQKQMKPAKTFKQHPVALSALGTTQTCKQNSALAKHASGPTVSKSSSSTKHLPICKKKFNQSLLVFGSTAKDRNSTAKMDVVKSPIAEDQSGPALADVVAAFADKTVRLTKSKQQKIYGQSNKSKVTTNKNSDGIELNTKSFKKLMQATQIRQKIQPQQQQNQQHMGSYEDSSTYLGQTCTASGPLNPFLEQILKEIPNAVTQPDLASVKSNAGCNINGSPSSQYGTEKHYKSNQKQALTKKLKKKFAETTKKSNQKLNVKKAIDHSRGSANYTADNTAAIKEMFSMTANAAALLTQATSSQVLLAGNRNIFMKPKARSISGTQCTSASKRKYANDNTSRNQEQLPPKRSFTNNGQQININFTCNLTLAEKDPEVKKVDAEPEVEPKAKKTKTYKVMNRGERNGEGVKASALLNVVKVAARQKEMTDKRKQAMTTVSNHTGAALSLNNTQLLAHQLQALRQANHSERHTQKPSKPSKPKASTPITRSRARSRKKPSCQNFDWSGLLANLMQEHLKPKKSTTGMGVTVGSALCPLKEYQDQNTADLANKTQPLPKNIIGQNDLMSKEEEEKDEKDGEKVAENDQCRPRIGNNKQVEIVSNLNFYPSQTVPTPEQIEKQLEESKVANTILSEMTSPVADGKKPDSSSPSSLSTYRSPEKVKQDFTFGRQLGEGAYAVVKIARRKNDGKDYAVKIYDKSKLVDEHRRTSVCREVMLMQKIKHVNIVEFKEAFETNQNVFVVMEHVDGQSLHDYLKGQKAADKNCQYNQTLPEEETKRLLKQVLSVLDYLHKEGISHRDIKLENVLLDKNNNVRLIDFGFSTQFDVKKKVKMFCGTPSYMAPEIVSRVEYCGPPADIWASGILLFCLLNGYFPFKGQTDAELYRRIQRGAFKILRTDLSDECLSILKEMLNVNAETRFSALEVLQDNWFTTDSSKKRSIIEIKRQFKAKILEKFPIRNVTKNTICIPGQAAESFPPKEERKPDSVTKVIATSAHHNSSEDDAINKEALIAYYNTTGLPDTAPTGCNNYRDGSSMIPLAQDLIVESNTNNQQPPKGTQNPSSMTNLSPYVAFNQGNVQGTNGVITTSEAFLGFKQHPQLFQTAITERKPISVLDKDTQDSAKIYPQFQLHIPTTQQKKGDTDRRSESNCSAMSYGTRPANRQ